MEIQFRKIFQKTAWKRENVGPWGLGAGRYDDRIDTEMRESGFVFFLVLHMEWGKIVCSFSKCSGAAYHDNIHPYLCNPKN